MWKNLGKMTGCALVGLAALTTWPTVAQTVTPIGQLTRYQGITLRGTIRRVVGNDFILDDGTGQILVDAGPRWYHRLNLREGEQVTVVGKYDDDDFDALRIIRANGEVVEIRPQVGPPPWSGGRRRGKKWWDD